MAINFANVTAISRGVITPPIYMPLNSYNSLVFGQGIASNNSHSTGFDDSCLISTNIPYDTTYKYVLRVGDDIGIFWENDDYGFLFSFSTGSTDGSRPRTDIFIKRWIDNGVDKSLIKCNFSNQSNAGFAVDLISLSDIPSGGIDIVVQGTPTTFEVSVYGVSSGTQIGSTVTWGSLPNLWDGAFTLSPLFLFGPYLNDTQTCRGSLYSLKVYNSSNTLIHDLRPAERDYMGMPEYGGNLYPEDFWAVGMYDVVTSDYFPAMGTYSHQDNTSGYASYAAVDTMLSSDTGWYGYSTYHTEEKSVSSIAINGVTVWPNTPAPVQDDWDVPAWLSTTPVSTTTSTNSLNQTVYSSSYLDGDSNFHYAQRIDEVEAGGQGMPGDGKFRDITYEFTPGFTGSYQIICEFSSSSSGMNLAFDEANARGLHVYLNDVDLTLNPHTPTEAGQVAGTPSKVVLACAAMTANTTNTIRMTQSSYRLVMSDHSGLYIYIAKM